MGARGSKPHFETLKWPLVFLCIGSLKSPLSEMTHLWIYNLYSSIQRVQLNTMGVKGQNFISIFIYSYSKYIYTCILRGITYKDTKKLNEHCVNTFIYQKDSRRALIWSDERMGYLETQSNIEGLRYVQPEMHQNY